MYMCTHHSYLRSQENCIFCYSVEEKKGEKLEDYLLNELLDLLGTRINDPKAPSTLSSQFYSYSRPMINNSSKRIVIRAHEFFENSSKIEKYTQPHRIHLTYDSPYVHPTHSFSSRFVRPGRAPTAKDSFPSNKLKFLSYMHHAYNLLFGLQANQKLKI